MSVQKYRDVGDMPSVSNATSADLARRIRATWARARRLAGGAYMVGVQKFSDLQEARAAREQAIRARARRLGAVPRK